MQSFLSILRKKCIPLHWSTSYISITRHHDLTTNAWMTRQILYSDTTYQSENRGIHGIYIYVCVCVYMCVCWCVCVCFYEWVRSNIIVWWTICFVWWRYYLMIDLKQVLACLNRFLMKWSILKVDVNSVLHVLVDMIWGIRFRIIS